MAASPQSSELADVRHLVQVTQLFSGYVVAALQQYATSPGENWRAKDSAIYLVVALAVQGRTAAQDASSTNQLVNIPDFFNQARAASLTGPPAWGPLACGLQPGRTHATDFKLASCILNKGLAAFSLHLCALHLCALLAKSCLLREMKTPCTARQSLEAKA